MICEERTAEGTAIPSTQPQEPIMEVEKYLAHGLIYQFAKSGHRRHRFYRALISGKIIGIIVDYLITR